MKIKLLNRGGYQSLVMVNFPFEIECEDFRVYDEELSGLDIPFDVIASIPGFMYNENDTEYGAPYYFAQHEIEVLP